MQNAGGDAAQPFRRCRAGAGRLPPEDSHCQAGWASGLYKPRGGWKVNRLCPRRWAFCHGKGPLSLGKTWGELGKTVKIDE